MTLSATGACYYLGQDADRSSWTRQSTRARAPWRPLPERRGRETRLSWRAHGRLEPASGEDEVWPIGRFAIGGHHVRSRPGDDDFMAVELDMKVHVPVTQKKKGPGARDMC